jgi:uracil-DNA glycosylase family 4
MEPSLGGSLGVALIGDQLGKDEVENGRPFSDKSGFKLSRLLEWAGFKREEFDIFNSVWCRPSDDRLEGTGYEHGAVHHCRDRHWGSLIKRSRVLVPMGNVATSAILGRKGILGLRGYVWEHPQAHVIPTVHPQYIRAGNANFGAVFISDIRKAVNIALHGIEPQFTNYTLDPLPQAAMLWAQGYLDCLRRDPTTKLAFDIETPGKGEDEDDSDGELDASWNIERIGFSYRPYEAISVPFDPAYYSLIRTVLSTAGDKVVWNKGFDVPRLAHAGFNISGIIHDGMVAWHYLHSDLPKSLAFVATMVCPFQPAWKHLSGSRPAFYNATDNDVELRAMLEIERELKSTSMWDIYMQDVVMLEPILVHMQSHGMPVDADIRLDRAIKLEQKLGEAHQAMTAAVPLGARRIAIVYARTPSDTTQLLSRPGVRVVPTCPVCGLDSPPKAHFKTFKRKVNPCAGAEPRPVRRDVQEYYRLAEFTPSREQLTRYHELLGRPLPRVRDKKTRQMKVSFGEKQIKELRIKYADDPLYPLILEHRKLDKLAGTYIGRPCE